MTTRRTWLTGIAVAVLGAPIARVTELVFPQPLTLEEFGRLYVQPAFNAWAQAQEAAILQMQGYRLDSVQDEILIEI